MTTPLKILSLLLVLLLTGAAFARNVPFLFVFFDQLRSKPSFQARVGSIAYWDPKEPGVANGGFTKEGRSRQAPALGDGHTDQRHTAATYLGGCNDSASGFRAQLAGEQHLPFPGGLG